MKKIFRYSRFHYLALLFFCFPAFFLVRGFLSEAFPVQNYFYSIILLLFVILIFGAIIQYWRAIEIQIITDADTIEIRKPFHFVRWSWEDISEFGKYRRIAYGYGGGGYWVYYLKAGLRNKKSVLGTKGLKNLEELVLYILFKAYRAKIINIQKAEKINN